MNDNIPQDLFETLKSRLTSNRQARLEQVVKNRSRFLQLVLDGVADPHNISACLRSADAFGIQDIHIVHYGKGFKTSTVAKGVEKWLTIHRYENAQDCIKELRKRNLLLCGAYPRQGAKPLADIPISKPLALVFGNEHHGISKEWMEQLDICFTIPMVGFVESLNISVSCATSLYTLWQKASAQDEYFLSSSDKKMLLNEWTKESIPSWQTEYKHAKTLKEKF